MSPDTKYRIKITPCDGWTFNWHWRVQESGVKGSWSSIAQGYSYSEEGAERRAMKAWRKYSEKLDFRAERSRTIDLG